MGNDFPKILRVVDAREFTRILGSGSYAADQTLVVNAIKETEATVVTGLTHGDFPTRLGISIPKKTGNAVTRNRWKRLIREAFRTQKPKLPVGFALIVRPRRGASPDFGCIQQSLLRLSQRASRNALKQSRSK